MTFNDFGGFDKAVNKQYWRASFLKNRREPVLVLSFSWYRARLAASSYWGTELGEVELENAQGSSFVPEWCTVLVTDEQGEVTSFKTTGNTCCERVGRGSDVRQWERLERQGGREDDRHVGGVQTNGQNSIHVEVGDVATSPDSGTESRKNTNGAGRLRNGNNGSLRHSSAGNSRASSKGRK